MTDYSRDGTYWPYSNSKLWKDAKYNVQKHFGLKNGDNFYSRDFDGARVQPMKWNEK